MNHPHIPPIAALAESVDALQTPAESLEPTVTSEPEVITPAIRMATPFSFPEPATVLTQAASKGIRFDFNLGCRVAVPEGKWRVRLTDQDTGNILYERETHSVIVNSTKRYFVRFRVDIWENGEPFLTHDFDAAGKDVLIAFAVGTLGDPLAWFPYAVKFQEKHGCRLTCAMSSLIIPLFKEAYPEINFVTHEEVEPEKFYATYYLGLFFTDAENIWQPTDFRHVGLHRTAGYILGVDPEEQRPRVAIASGGRPIEEPYVCIAAQSSSQCKYWNNPTGWREVVAFLKESGYRVICIDKQATHGHRVVWNHIPYGAEDFTGEIPLQERARWLVHADFFVGLSSGLSWLAWTVGAPVVLISGFTHPTNEFHTPARVINYHVCNSCWNDPRQIFDHKDFMWCPRHSGTDRQFECTRLITAELVKKTINMIKYHHNIK